MGHLDLMRHFQRAAKRAGVPLAYSQGFNPHPRMTIAAPLPVGSAGYRELAAFDLTELREPSEVVEQMNRCLPSGVEIIEGWTASPGRGTFGTRLLCEWEAGIRLEEAAEGEGAAEALKGAVQEILAADSLVVERREGSPKDIRSRISDLGLEQLDGTEAVLRMMLIQDEKFGARPQDVLGALEGKVGRMRLLSLRRRDLSTSPTSESEQKGGD